MDACTETFATLQVHDVSELKKHLSSMAWDKVSSMTQWTSGKTSLDVCSCRGRAFWAF